jgi:hypothetical protein
MDQNEPSRPEVARLKSDKLEEGLKNLFLSTFEEFEEDEEPYDIRAYRPDELTLFKAESWGDLVISDNNGNSNNFVFVTFEDKAMLKGLKLKKPQGFCA